MPGKAVGGRTVIKRIVKYKVRQCKDVVKKMVKTAKESNIKFTLGTDSWKDKGEEAKAL